VDWLNYHHLLYFWAVAHDGGLRPASERLLLAPQTLSGQIRALERSMGEKLFRRSGRRLVLTDTGQLVYRYAGEIFALGQELAGAVRGKPTGRPPRLVVGIADVLPKLVVHRILEPAFRLAEGVRMVCREDGTERLLAALALHEVDVVLSDAPAAASPGFRAFSHLLGGCGTSFHAVPALTASVRRGFPRSLDGKPMLLPTEGTSFRRSLDQWFDTLGVRPRVVAEFQDSALLQAFGQQGLGIFPAPTVIDAEVRRQFGVRLVGRTDDVRERFYAVSLQRRVGNPAVVAILEQAKAETFGAAQAGD
jgi:LysR family transcriptional activator of nhaA